MIRYKEYFIETCPAGDDHLDHKEDIVCHVYKRYSGKETRRKKEGSFLVTGNEIGDYGSKEAAVIAYMRRAYPNNVWRDRLMYRLLTAAERQLHKRYKKLLIRLLSRNGARITSFPIPDEDGCSDYPIVEIFYGKYDNPSISVTDVYLNEYGEIMIDGINEQRGSRERGFQAYPEHYSSLLHFATQALGFSNHLKTK